jgi:hypothetical protein
MSKKKDLVSTILELLLMFILGLFGVASKPQRRSRGTRLPRFPITGWDKYRLGAREHEVDLGGCEPYEDEGYAADGERLFRRETVFQTPNGIGYPANLFLAFRRGRLVRVIYAIRPPVPGFRTARSVAAGVKSQLLARHWPRYKWQYTKFEDGHLELFDDARNNIIVKTVNDGGPDEDKPQVYVQFASR